MFAVIVLGLGCDTTFAQFLGDLVGDEERIAELEAEVKALTEERDALLKRVEELEGGTPSAEKTATVIRLDSLWRGKSTVVQGGKTIINNVDFTVIAREEKNVTFQMTSENGALWELDCEFTTPKRFKLIQARRRLAAIGVNDPKDLTPAGGYTGFGSTSGKKLSMQVSNRTDPNGPLVIKFDLSAVEQ
jgi:hypothetical protein